MFTTASYSRRGKQAVISVAANVAIGRRGALCQQVCQQELTVAGWRATSLLTEHADAELCHADHEAVSAWLRRAAQELTVVGRRAPSLPTLRLDVAPALAAYTRLARLELEPQARARPPHRARLRHALGGWGAGWGDGWGPGGRVAPARGCLTAREPGCDGRDAPGTARMRAEMGMHACAAGQ